MNPVAIVIPVYKEKPDEGEIKSLQQCVKILQGYPFILAAPETLDLTVYMTICDQLDVQRFGNEYFSDISGYNRLMLSQEFYTAFAAYEYILIHQLDAYVFKDELSYWCSLGYDYIGAPVYQVQLNSFEPVMEAVTLNGGFSLRKVQSHLNVLNQFKMIYPFRKVLTNNIRSVGFFAGTAKGVYNYLRANNTYHRLNRFDRNEDFFWALLVPRVNKRFSVPEVAQSAFFSFDNYPERSFEQTNGQLPFGCHAFMKYRYFWKEYMEL